MHPFSRRKAGTLLYGGLIALTLVAALVASRAQPIEAAALDVPGVCNTLQNAFDSNRTGTPPGGDADCDGDPGGGDTVQLVSGSSHTISIAGARTQNLIVRGVPGGAAETIDMSSLGITLIGSLEFENVTLTNLGSITVGNGTDAGTLNLDNVIIETPGANSRISVTDTGTISVLESTLSNFAPDAGLPVIGSGGIAFLTDSQFSNNLGPVIRTTGAGAETTIDGSTFTANDISTVENRDGGTTDISYSTFDSNGNTAANAVAGVIGGAISNEDGEVNIEASALFGNRATESGGAIANVASGGTALVTLVNVTLHNNDAPTGSHIYNVVTAAESGDATVTMLNVTVTGGGAGFALYSDIVPETSTGEAIIYMKMVISAEHTGRTCGPDNSNFSGLNPPPGFVSRGYNLLDDPEDLGDGTPNESVYHCHITTGDTIDAPNLGALGDNGGETLTRALLDGSRGIDEGINTGSADLGDGDCPEADQRDVGRPIDGDYFNDETTDEAAVCDIGAYEYEPDGIDPTCEDEPTPPSFEIDFCLVFVKETSPDGSTQSFDFDITIDPTNNAPNFVDTFSLEDGDYEAFDIVGVGATFDVTEDETDGWELTNITCSNNTLVTITDLTRGKRLVIGTPGDGGPVPFAVCTFTNTEVEEPTCGENGGVITIASVPEPADRCLLVHKHVIDGDGDPEFNFEATGDIPTDTFVLGDEDTHGIPLDLAGGDTITITEEELEDWELVDIDCDVNGFSVGPIVDNSVTLTAIEFASGSRWAVCVFENEEDGYSPPSPTPTATRTPTATPTKTVTPTATPTFFYGPNDRPNVGGIFMPNPQATPQPTRTAPQATAPAAGTGATTIRPPSTGDGGLR